MNLGLISRTRVTLGRPVAHWIHGSAWARRRLLKDRAVEGLDPDMAMMLALDDLTRDSQIWRFSPQGARRKVAESVALVDGPGSREVQTEDRGIPGSVSELRVRVYVPKDGAKRSPGVVYFHGGGFVTCDLDTHDALCRRIAEGAGIRVVAIEYRLAPEHPFPAQVDDGLAAFRWVTANAESLGIDPSRIAVAGDSAGGNLSAVIALRTRKDERRPALAALIYPALDGTCAARSQTELAEGFFLTKKAIDWYYGHYVGTDPAKRRDPDVSPLFAEDLAGCPPMIVVSAWFDPLRDEAIAFAERLRRAGVPTLERCERNLVHGFLMMTGLSKAADQTSSEIIRTIGRALSEGRLPAV